MEIQKLNQLDDITFKNTFNTPLYTEFLKRKFRVTFKDTQESKHVHSKLQEHCKHPWYIEYEPFATSMNQYFVYFSDDDDMAIMDEVWNTNSK